jgi:hypothetical protein
MKHIVAIVAAVLVATGSYAPEGLPAGPAYADASRPALLGGRESFRCSSRHARVGNRPGADAPGVEKRPRVQSAPPQLQAFEVGAIKIVYDKPPLSKAETMQSRLRWLLEGLQAMSVG